MEMIYTAIAFFSLAAIIGLSMLSVVLKGGKPSRALVFTHGPLAATGIVLLILYSLNNSPGPKESIILFCIAAAGGVTLFAHDFLGRAIPKWLAVLHGMIAVTGFVFLLVFAL